MSGWDTLKHENARWLDGLQSVQPSIQPTIFGAGEAASRRRLGVPELAIMRTSEYLINRATWVAGRSVVWYNDEAPDIFNQGKAGMVLCQM